MPRVLPFALAALLGAAALGCRPPPPAPAPPRDLDAEARAAAAVFWQCFERDGRECRHLDAPYRAWAALRALLAVRDRSPLALVDELGRAFRELRDDRLARKAFITGLGRHEELARTSPCSAGAVRPLGTGIEALGTAAEARVVELGLGDTAAGSAVGELGEWALGLREAREVRLDCEHDVTLHLVVAPTPDGAWHPVELGEAPIDLGPRPDDEAPLTLTVGDPAAMDAWLPFGEDQL
jgi:hypothetical protein